MLRSTSRVIESFVLNVKKVAKAKLTSGFFALTTHRLDLGAVEVLGAYRLRDLQEKYFMVMRGQMDGSCQRVWSEDGKAGRLLIGFVGLVLGSYLRYVWRSTELKGEFCSSLEVLDEMRSIRCIEHVGGESFVTPFVGVNLIYVMCLVLLCLRVAHQIMYLGAKVSSTGVVLERKSSRGINSTKCVKLTLLCSL